MIIACSGKIGSGKDTVGQIIQYLSIQYRSIGSIGWSEENLAYLLKGNSLSKNIDVYWQIKKFADKLKQCISIITGILREDLEKIEVKNSNLPIEWWYDIKGHQIEGFHREIGTTYTMTVRQLLQEFGTEACRTIIHPNFWVNALFADYKMVRLQSNFPPNQWQRIDTPIYPNWIITDLRFPNELKAIEDRGGITIRINRTIRCKDGLSDIGHRSIQEQHISETALDDANFDYTIDNNCSIEDLIKQVKKILIIEKIIN